MPSGLHTGRDDGDRERDEHIERRALEMETARRRRSVRDLELLPLAELSADERHQLALQDAREAA
jgi:hypothetical protein